MPSVLSSDLVKAIAAVARSKGISDAEAHAVLLAAGASALAKTGDVPHGHAQAAQTAASNMINAVQQSARSVSGIANRAKALLDKSR
jgi:hypothetical protein